MIYKCKRPFVRAFQMTFNHFSAHNTWPQWLLDIFNIGGKKNNFYLSNTEEGLFILKNYKGYKEIINHGDWIVKYNSKYIKMSEYEFRKHYKKIINN